jgi:hypothetical protein
MGDHQAQLSGKNPLRRQEMFAESSGAAIFSSTAFNDAWPPQTAAAVECVTS